MALIPFTATQKLQLPPLLLLLSLSVPSTSHCAVMVVEGGCASSVEVEVAGSCRSSSGSRSSNTCTVEGGRGGQKEGGRHNLVAD